MSYARGRFYAFKDAKSGKLEFNFPQETAYGHNHLNDCGGHLFAREEVEEIKRICEEYLNDT